MRTSALFGSTNFGFFEIYGVSARTRGEGGQFLAILCGCPLWTATKCKRGIIHIIPKPWSNGWGENENLISLNKTVEKLKQSKRDNTTIRKSQ